MAQSIFTNFFSIYCVLSEECRFPTQRQNFLPRTIICWWSETSCQVWFLILHCWEELVLFAVVGDLNAFWSNLISCSFCHFPNLSASQGVTKKSSHHDHSFRFFQPAAPMNDASHLYGYFFPKMAAIMGLVQVMHHNEANLEGIEMPPRSLAMPNGGFSVTHRQFCCGHAQLKLVSMWMDLLGIPTHIQTYLFRTTSSSLARRRGAHMRGRAHNYIDCSKCQTFSHSPEKWPELTPNSIAKKWAEWKIIHLLILESDP